MTIKCKQFTCKNKFHLHVKGEIYHKSTTTKKTTTYQYDDYKRGNNKTVMIKNCSRMSI